MTTHKRTTVLLVAATVTMVALGRFSSARADESVEEKPPGASAAQLSRDAAGHIFIAIRPQIQKEIGITTKPLERIVRPREVEAYGFILDPAPLSKLNNDLLTAQAALSAADAQYQRTRRLYADQKNASLRDLQGAQASYLADKSQLGSLEQQLRNDWGEKIALMDPQSRSRLVGALIDRREAIARLTVPIGDLIDDAPYTAEIAVVGHEGQPLNTQAVYPAPTVVPTLQGQTFFVLVAAREFPIRSGAAASARIPTSSTSEQGVVVPRSAVVRYAGDDWVYRQLAGDRFVRLEIVPVEITDRGYFVTENIAPGMRIVISGAQTLLSEELKAQIQPRE